MNIGDKVRYLNAVGGGVIRRIDGRIAYVEEDGFETPVLMSDLVVVLPAGHEGPKSGARLLFDQEAYDTGRSKKAAPRPEPQAPSKETPNPNEAEVPVKPKPVETEYGDRLSLTLAFEPTQLKSLSDSKFTAVLVNDSNYRLLFNFLSRQSEAAGWQLRFSGEVEPNELIDLGVFTHETLGEIEKVAIQAIAFKEDAMFDLKFPVNATVRLNLTKFHKLHCFRPGKYFDEPVIEIPLVEDDRRAEAHEDEQTAVKALKAKYEKTSPGPKSEDRAKPGKKIGKIDLDARNPHKLLPLIQVDLHIAELTDTVAGMTNADMLTMQLEEVRKTMKAHRLRKGQKIVFIHGKGDGVLRKAVRDLLRKEYECDIQDASFREYGFGATLVTI